MEKRQEELLKQIVKIYIRTAEPVGSVYLAEKIGDISSATVRNEMMTLEEKGWITQPHISAGRVPTVKAYRYYVDNFVRDGRVDKLAERDLLDIVEKAFGETAVKDLAKLVAEKTDSAVIVAFSTDQLYYTGLSYLFAQPEFKEQSQVTSVSQILENCEEVLPSLLESMAQQRQILIGEENPFSVQCSFIITPMDKNGEKGMFGILGPTRMDYDKNIGLINFIHKLLNK